MSNTDDTTTGAAEASEQTTDTGSTEHPEQGPEQTMESMTQAEPQGIEDPEGIEAIMGDGMGG